MYETGHGDSFINSENIKVAFEQLVFDKECLDAIESCAAHQKVITDDVLHLSRLRHGKIVMRRAERRRFSVKNVLESVRKMFAAELDRLGVHFVVQWVSEIEGSLDIQDSFVWGDPDRLGQVLIKYVAGRGSSDVALLLLTCFCHFQPHQQRHQVYTTFRATAY